MTKNEKNIIEHYAKIISNDTSIEIESASTLLEKSYISSEIKKLDENTINEWYNNRFLPNSFKISHEDYLRACINALKIQFLIAGTDYGTSRQRDLGQKWSDTIRGYVGEIGFQKLLESRWGIKSELGHEEGTLDEYINLDIHQIKKQNEQTMRKLNLNISVKTTKFNGIWLDIPGKQFGKSDIYTFVKIGVATDNLFAFFKSISVFKDKILKCGTDNKCITEDEANHIFDKLPSFNPIVGYICGFAVKDNDYKELNYGGTKGSKNYKINKWNGPYEPSNIAKIKIDLDIKGKVEFEGIGQFSNEKRYIFNTGSLYFSNDDWENKIISKI